MSGFNGVGVGGDVGVELGVGERATVGSVSTHSLCVGDHWGLCVGLPALLL